MLKQHTSFVRGSGGVCSRPADPEGTMTRFSADDCTLLAYLVPAAQRLIAIDGRMFEAWAAQLSDYERTLLIQWIVLQGLNKWRTAPPPKAE